MKHYVYLIVDNFSRMIINWHVDTKLSGLIRTQTLKDAIQQEFNLNVKDIETIDLIVDEEQKTTIQM